MTRVVELSAHPLREHSSTQLVVAINDSGALFILTTCIYFNNLQLFVTQGKGGQDGHPGQNIIPGKDGIPGKHSDNFPLLKLLREANNETVVRGK